ncbi:MAG: hypothetical protein R3F17_17450, partial [Planctomycetota bacterium]
MRDPEDTGAGSVGGDSSGYGNAEERKWNRLRELLLSEEEQRLTRLEQDPPKVEGLASVLPEAVRHSEKQTEELANALRPTIEQGLLRSARQNPDDLAEAIYPVLGPAIRRSIRATLQASLQSMNVALENSFSPRGVRWRMEAWRTGRPFGEVVLLNSLEYRVEQIYWIHRETGLLLQQATSDSPAASDPELVSGMLAAIGEFVRDSFQGAEEGELEQIEVSGFRVLVAQGPNSSLAALVRGVPPEQLSEDMHAALETLHRRYAEELDGFEGDVDGFAPAQRDLAGLLGEQAKERGKGGPAGRILVGVAALLLLTWLGFWWAGHRTETRRADALERLSQTPGYWVDGSAESDHWRILRDPVSTPIEAVLGPDREKLDVRFDVSEFQSLDPALRARRVAERLDLPPTVHWSWFGDTLVLSGEASEAWIAAKLPLARALPGAHAVDASALVSTERQAVETRLAALDGLMLP